MDFPLPWLVILAVLIGHFGLNVAIYNRINGTAIPRWTLKRITKVLLAWTLLGPLLITFFYYEFILDFFWGQPVQPPLLISCYAYLCFAAWVVFGIPWVIWRPVFKLEWVTAERRVETIDVQSTTGNELALTSKCKIARHLPWNQILELSVEEIALPVRGLPEGLDGYRIAHLSDIHLTGDIHPDFASYAVLRAAQWKPDLMALTGDIIDKQICVDWLVDIFSSVDCRDGCFFVLGNHDTRIVDSRQTREAMSRAGWTDLGGRSLRVPLASGVDGMLIGNEFPWFTRPQIPTEHDSAFRILLSHSPDQFWWARRHHVSLMLAGHTHGGQGRLPLAGPILGPSYHGSRFAAGDFYRTPTTLHVSRGLSGTHLLRLNCRPELSLITLRALPNGVENT
ncbi:MAG: metallophosphoesterase [Rubripirellula sp.]